jgi:1,4-alpha-glucan branching enzyme
MTDTDKALYLFHQGTYYKSYEFFGCHFLHEQGSQTRRDKKCDYGKAVFRVWAPHAKAVSLLGDFNDWDNRKHVMTKLNKDGVWEVTVDYVAQFHKYKYEITCADGKKLLKSDPYATFNQTNGETASMVYDINGYKWNDAEYREKQKHKNPYESPINIYEVNLSSWRRQPDHSHYTYSMFADELVDYCVEMGYTHIEIMPINEYPFEGSWGYQCTGYFSVTSRFGTPHDFMYLVDRAHQKGIGIILDWVPSHFPKDEFALIEFDGKPLYEHPRWDRQEHASWGTRRFDYGRTEVQSFLTSSAMLLFDYYHIDGLRVDAVASMLYLDYDKKAGEWLPNDQGGNEHLEAIAFLQKLNTAIFKDYPHALMMAEESTAWPMVTKPVSMGGLGFNFKWNMGWMNDVTKYITLDPWFRRHHHNKLTFSMMYAFTEQFLLPISHDEVVYGKGSLINKMFGDYHQKFDGFRAFLTYMYTHPGKKLIFMGSEIAQFDEWDNDSAVQFHLLFNDQHWKTKNFVKELNNFYASHKELYEIDFDWTGFRWIAVDDKKSNTLAWARIAKDGSELICVFNFSLAQRDGYRLDVSPGLYEEVFGTTREDFGGREYRNPKMRTLTDGNGTNFIKVDLPPLSAVLLKKTLNEWTI